MTKWAWVVAVAYSALPCTATPQPHVQADATRAPAPLGGWVNVPVKYSPSVESSRVKSESDVWRLVRKNAAEDKRLRKHVWLDEARLADEEARRRDEDSFALALADAGDDEDAREEEEEEEAQASLMRDAVASRAMLLRGAPWALFRPPTVPGLRSGRFLISHGISGRAFYKTVILLIDHRPGGSMGVIVNRVLPQDRLLQAIDAKQEPKRRVSHREGGPVDPRSVGYLSATPGTGPHSSPVVGVDGIFWTVGEDELDTLPVGEGTVVAVHGYAGWSAGQLEHEMQREDWRLHDATAELVLEAPPGRLWSQLARKAMRLQRRQLRLAAEARPPVAAKWAPTPE